MYILEKKCLKIKDKTIISRSLMKKYKTNLKKIEKEILKTRAQMHRKENMHTIGSTKIKCLKRTILINLGEANKQ